MDSGKKKSKTLSLKERVELINFYSADEKNLTQEDLATKFGISRSQVQRILAKKDEILKQHAENPALENQRRTGLYFFV